jgi:hypothetical protein
VKIDMRETGPKGKPECPRNATRGALITFIVVLFELAHIDYS